MVRSVIILGITVICILGALLLVNKIFRANSLSLIKVGVVVPEDEVTTKYVTDFISSMDSVKSICSFEYLDENEAIERFNNKTLEAAVVLPSGFYHDVQTGINPPATIYFPKDSTMTQRLFRELILSGVSFLQTAEASVYSAIDTSLIYGSIVSPADIGNSLALEYVDIVFSRDKIYESSFVSIFDELGQKEFYFYGGMLILLMFSGICFNRMYERNNKAVDSKLKVEGLGAVKLGLIKILIMTPIVYLWAVIILLVGLGIGVEVKIGSFGGAFLVALTMSLYFHLIFALTKDSKWGIVVLCIFNILGALISGLIVPIAFLAPWTKILGEYLPMRWWMKIMCGCIGGGLL